MMRKVKEEEKKVKEEEETVKKEEKKVEKEEEEDSSARSPREEGTVQGESDKLAMVATVATFTK
jgi:hypothetical protein